MSIINHLFACVFNRNNICDVFCKRIRIFRKHISIDDFVNVKTVVSIHRDESSWCDFEYDVVILLSIIWLLFYKELIYLFISWDNVLHFRIRDFSKLWTSSMTLSFRQSESITFSIQLSMSRDTKKSSFFCRNVMIIWFNLIDIQFSNDCVVIFQLLRTLIAIFHLWRKLRLVLNRISTCSKSKRNCVELTILIASMNKSNFSVEQVELNIVFLMKLVWNLTSSFNFNQIFKTSKQIFWFVCQIHDRKTKMIF